MTDIRSCAHPGCGVHLGPTNQSGVCRVHNHGPSCLCSKCRLKPDRGEIDPQPSLRARRPTPPDRPGTMVVNVAGQLGSADDITRAYDVRLPRPPWL